MSEVQEEASVETGGREVLVRTFAVESQKFDGRTLHVRVVPFDEVATVADPPSFRPYKEKFLAGVFDRNERAANRILLRTDHAAIDDGGNRKSGLNGVVGRGVSLRQADGGYEGEFRLLSTPEAETARELIDGGVFGGVSAEFAPIKHRTIDGVVNRIKAHLDSVALAMTPAYSKAEILALREEAIREDDEEPFIPEYDKELLERCKRLNIALPERIQKALDADQQA